MTALSACAAVLLAMAVGVGLYALYRLDADSYGVYAGLGVVGGVLVAAALIPIRYRPGQGAVLVEASYF